MSPNLEDEGQLNNSLETVWSTFQLPIPIISKETYINDGPYDEWLFQALDLLRLLHTMNEQFNTQYTNAAQSNSISQRMKSQMKLACTLLEKVECTFPSLSQQQLANESNKTDVMLQNNHMFQENAHNLMQTLQHDTNDTCTRFQHWLDRHCNSQQQEERDLIYDMFLSTEDAYDNHHESSEELLDDKFSDDGIIDVEDSSGSGQQQSQTQQYQKQQPIRKQPPSATTSRQEMDPTKLQKQQQELLEAELSDMAKHLKNSTLAMNATLQTQTKDLDDMEVLAQTNLDQVTDTAKDVESRLKRNKGWKKRVATWSLIGTVIGMWILCFMIMRTVPKRQIRETQFWSKSKVGLQKVRDRTIIFWDKIKPTMPPDEDEEYEDEYDDEYGGPQSDHGIQEEEEEEVVDKEKWVVWDSEDEYWYQQQKKKAQKEAECEVLADGTQICQETKEAETNSFATENTCIPISNGMLKEQSKLDTILFASEDTSREIYTIPLKKGSTERVKLEAQMAKYDKELSKQKAIFEIEYDKALSEFWTNRANKVLARDQNRAMNSVPFCTKNGRSYEDQVMMDRESYRRKLEKERLHKQQQKMEAEEEEARRKMKELEQQQQKQQQQQQAQRQRIDEQAKLEKAEKDRIKQANMDAENNRQADEAARRLEAENERLEAEKKEAKRREKERIERVEIERLEKERLAEEARLVELEKVEQQKRELKRVLEQAKADANKATTLASQMAEDGPGFVANDVRAAASDMNKNDLLAYYIASTPEWIDASDRRGWRPIHESARAGNLIGIELLVSAGCDLSSRTGRTGNGGTALWWAIQRFGEDHSVVHLLRSHGALDIGPEI